MTIGKAAALTAGLVGAMALGVMVGPSITNRGDMMTSAPPAASVAPANRDSRFANPRLNRVMAGGRRPCWLSGRFRVVNRVTAELSASTVADATSAVTNRIGVICWDLAGGGHGLCSRPPRRRRESTKEVS